MGIYKDLSDAWLIFRKDLRLESRQKFEFLSMVLFSISSSFIFSLSLGISVSSLTPLSESEIRVTAASLWVIFIFAGMLSFSSIFGREIKSGSSSLTGLRSFPIKPQSLFLGKLIFNLGLLLVIQLIIIFIYVIFFKLSIQIPLIYFLFIISIGTLDFAVVGTLVSALAIYSRAKTLVIPILIFPLIIPSAIFSVNLLTDALLGNLVEVLGSDLALLFLHFIIILMISFLTIETILNE